MNRFLTLVSGAALSALLSLPAIAEPLEVKVLTSLDRFEPFEGHLFHAGHLWVGRSRKDLGAYYRLEVYDAAGNAVVTKELTHSLRYIYAYDTDSVLIVGLGTDGLSHYTIAKVRGSDVSVTAQTIPIEALADRWAGRPGLMIFSDPGGFDDPDHPTPPSQPLQTLFNYGRGQSRWLKPHIAGPRDGLLIGDMLYLVSAPTIESGGKMLHRIDLASESDKILLENRDRLVNMIRIPGTPLLALSEAGTGQVLLYDTDKRDLTDILKIGGGVPRGLATVGHCLLVGTEDTKQVQVFDLVTRAGAPIATFDLSSAGDVLYGLRDLAADPATGRIFARSAYACTPFTECSEVRNSVVTAMPPAGHPALKACLGG